MFGGSLAVMTEDLKNGIIACSPAIIFIVVVLIAALIVVAAAGKLKQPKRALVRAQAPIAILLAITLSVSGVILGVEYSVVNSVFAENVKVSDETMASGRAIADQIASEGIVLLKNDGKALPLSAGTKLNLFGWSSVRPLYGGTGSGDTLRRKFSFGCAVLHNRPRKNPSKSARPYSTSRQKPGSRGCRRWFLKQKVAFFVGLARECIQG